MHRSLAVIVLNELNEFVTSALHVGALSLFLAARWFPCFRRAPLEDKLIFAYSSSVSSFSSCTKNCLHTPGREPMHEHVLRPSKLYVFLQELIGCSNLE